MKIDLTNREAIILYDLLSMVAHEDVSNIKSQLNGVCLGRSYTKIYLDEYEDRIWVSYVEK